MRRTVLLASLSAAAIAACDQPVEPLTDTAQPTPAPPVVSMAALGTEGYPVRGEVRTGWIHDRTGTPREVSYEIHEGLAIWEGDIVLGRASEIATTRAELASRPMPGVVIDGASFRWPSGEMPYEIDPTLTNQARVTTAIRWVEDQTPGVTVVPRNGEADYVTFRPATGCSSAIGRQGGEQFINLATTCTTGNTAHEILHALGMEHEHSRCDRDDFVTINEDNIVDGAESNFNMYCDGYTDLFDYDEGSMMHYGPFAFAVDPTIPTIVSLRGLDNLMGQRNALGPTDVATIEALYGQFNLAPVAVIGPLAPSHPEGSPIPLVGSGSYDDDDDNSILTHLWVFEGRCPVGSALALCRQADSEALFPDDGAYPIELTVSDGFAESLPAQAVATVHNVAPIVDAGPDATHTSGDLFDFVGTFHDPGTEDHPWEWEIDWGFGEPTPGSTLDQTLPILASHQFCAAGAYVVQLSVTDKDGDTGTDAMTLTVEHVAIEIWIQPNADPAPINLNRRGLLPVAVLGSASMDAAALDPSTLTLGDGAGADTGVGQKNNGQFEAYLEDVNGDGVLDLVAMFPVPALVANGDLHAGTTELVLRAFLDDGCTNVMGAAAVAVTP